MNDLRTAAQQALAFTMRDFASLRDFEAAKAVLHDNLRTALAQQAEPAQEPITRLFGTLPVHDTQQALAQQAEPVEPFGYWFSDKHQDAVCSGWFVRSPCDGKLDGKPGVPLYTAPPQRKPLPKHDQHCVDVPGYGLMAVRLVRAVERAHGIKE